MSRSFDDGPLSSVHEIDFCVPGNAYFATTTDFSFLDCDWCLEGEWKKKNEGGKELQLSLICEPEGDEEEGYSFPQDLWVRVLVKRANSPAIPRNCTRTVRLLPTDVNERISFFRLQPCSIRDMASSPFRNDDGSFELIISLFTQATKSELPSPSVPASSDFLLAMFDNPDDSGADVVLKSDIPGDLTCVRAHRNILRYRSVYLHRMLDSTDAHCGEDVLFQGIRGASLAILVRTLYGAPLPASLASSPEGFMTLLEIWKSAAGYQLQGIADICAELATACAQTDTFIQCYQTAFDVGNGKAKKKLAMVFYKMSTLRHTFNQVLSDCSVEVVADLISNMPNDRSRLVKHDSSVRVCTPALRVVSIRVGAHRLRKRTRGEYCACS